MKIINLNKMKRTMTSKTTTGVDSLEHEIEILKKLDSPYCVKFEEVIADEEDNRAYIALEYMDNGTLEDLHKSGKCMPGEVMEYFKQIILGLEYIHSQGIVHRDIKPDNMLLNKKGELKIADFGISKILNNDNDIFTNTAGTDYFHCPESCKKLPYGGKKADVWACGVTLYFLLFGRFPFNGASHMELNDEICNKDPMLEIYCEDSISDLLNGMLDKDPESRITIDGIKTLLKC